MPTPRLIGNRAPVNEHGNYEACACGKRKRTTSRLCKACYVEYDRQRRKRRAQAKRYVEMHMLGHQLILSPRPGVDFAEAIRQTIQAVRSQYA